LNVLKNSFKPKSQSRKESFYQNSNFSYRPLLFS